MSFIKSQYDTLDKSTEMLNKLQNYSNELPRDLKRIRFGNTIGGNNTQNSLNQSQYRVIQTSKSYVQQNPSAQKSKSVNNFQSSKYNQFFKQTPPSIIKELYEDNQALRVKNKELETKLQQQELINQRNKTMVQQLLNIIQQKSDLIQILNQQNTGQENHQADLMIIYEYVKHFITEPNIDINMSCSQID